MIADEVIDDILRREGGFVDSSADRGGATNYGITALVLGQWRALNRAATRAEVQALTESEARTIYRTRYIVGPGFDAVQDPALQGLLVDIAVNSGPATAVKMLQRALGFAGTEADGRFGPATRAALARHPSPRALFVDVWRRRQQLYLSLALNEPATQSFIEAHPTAQLRNLAGWLSRNAEFVA